MQKEHTARVAKAEVTARKILRGKIQIRENRGNDPFIFIHDLESQIIKFGIKFHKRGSSIFLIYYFWINYFFIEYILKNILGRI